MATRINRPYSYRQKISLDAAPRIIMAGQVCDGVLPQGEASCADTHGGAENSCSRCVEFCETLSVPASFDLSGVCEEEISIAYDSSFLSYSLQPVSMELPLPCGGSCSMEIFKISLSGAIPYILSLGPVRGRCGDTVCISQNGVVMVDTVLGYLCEEEEAPVWELGCENLVADTKLEAESCECEGKNAVRVRGSFCFTDLPIFGKNCNC